MGMDISGMTLAPAEINGSPGTLIMTGGRAIAALTLTVSGGRITAIQLLVNPDKLTAITAGRTLPM
jgi:RNA polymerase sigma-70 factor (ECF subfamily)